MSTAREILHGIEPSPHFVPTDKTGSSGLVSTLWYGAKQLLLWHNAETLEDKPVVSGVHGMKLQSATTLLEKAAEVRNPDAMFLLAEMNFYGNWSMPRNYKTAYRWYKELADTHGNHTAQHMVGFMHATGIGGAVKKDQGMVGSGKLGVPMEGNTANCGDRLYYIIRLRRRREIPGVK